MRTKMITVQLVTVDAELLQQAVDHLASTNGIAVVFQMVNGRCVSVDTETVPVRLVLPSVPAEGEPARLMIKSAPIDVTASAPIDVTADVILGLLAKGEQTAMQLSDTLGLDRKGTGRIKVSRLLGMLKNTGKIAVRVEHGVCHYKINRFMMTEACNKADRETMRRRITKDAITLILRERGESSSRAISDALALPRGDNIRSLVSTTLARMVKDNELEKHGKKPGAAVYRLAKAA